MAGIYNDWTAGRRDDAVSAHMGAQAFNRFLEYEPGYVAPCKEALRLLGVPCGPVRPPLPELTDEEKRGIRAALEQLRLPVAA
jgi:dihydrodipicolinate synthase/N-acetylneuraminate lyase